MVFSSLNRALALPFLATELRLLEPLTKPPDRLRWLFRLKFLTFSSVEQITPVVAELPKLAALSVWRSLREIDPEIARARSLRSLSLCFAPDAPTPKALDSLDSLERLEVEGLSVEAVETAIEALPRLRFLAIRGTALEHVPPWVLRSPMLEELILQGTNIRALPAALFTGSASLKKLTVEGNVERVPDEVERASALEVLDLSGNALTELPASIRRLARLSTLRVADNRLTSRARGELLRGLRAQQTLELVGPGCELRLALPAGEALGEHVPGTVSTSSTHRSDYTYEIRATAAGHRLYAEIVCNNEEMPAASRSHTLLAELPPASGSRPSDAILARWATTILGTQLPSCAALFDGALEQLGPLEAIKLAIRTASLVGLRAPLAALLEAPRLCDELTHVARAACVAAHGTLALQLGGYFEFERSLALAWPLKQSFARPTSFSGARPLRRDPSNETKSLLEFDGLQDAFVRSVAAGATKALEADPATLRAAFALDGLQEGELVARLRGRRLAACAEELVQALVGPATSGPRLRQAYEALVVIAVSDG